MARRFVLVTAVDVSSYGTRSASGIKKLKRGVTIHEFIQSFMSSVGASKLIERNGWYACSTEFNGHHLHWTFTEYPEDALFEAVAHLTRDELLRDLPELLPLR